MGEVLVEYFQTDSLNSLAFPWPTSCLLKSDGDHAGGPLLFGKQGVPGPGVFKLGLRRPLWRAVPVSFCCSDKQTQHLRGIRQCHVRHSTELSCQSVCCTGSRCSHSREQEAERATAKPHSQTPSFCWDMASFVSTHTPLKKVCHETTGRIYNATTKRVTSWGR